MEAYTHLEISVISLWEKLVGGPVLQHLVVGVVFAVCLCLIVCRVVRIVSKSKRSDGGCSTCTDTTCPLREAKKSVKKCDKPGHGAEV